MKTINSSIEDVQELINEMDKINGFKKKLEAHAKITTYLQKCKELVNEMTNSINTPILNENDNDKFVEITDDEFKLYIDKLNEINDTFDTVETVEEMMILYRNAMNQINIVSNYLEKRKCETILIK